MALDSPRDLVAQRFAGDDGDLLTHSLVDVEVVAQAGVVLLYDHPSGFLHGLGSHAPLSYTTVSHSSEGHFCTFD